jgi:hypothetical protein
VPPITFECDAASQVFWLSMPGMSPDAAIDAIVAIATMGVKSVICQPTLLGGFGVRDALERCPGDLARSSA